MTEIQTLRNAFKRDKNIRIMRKTEFDIFYSCLYKYPLITVEDIHENTGKSADGKPIKRGEIKDPFKADPSLPKECRMLVRNYTDYMQYGGSLGHNAPAVNHKTNMATYASTFLISNMCPQEIVFNGSLWVILETWCYILKNDNRLKDIKVYTGSIPDVKNIQVANTTINIPRFMFKVVTCRLVAQPNKFLIACFLMPNEPPKTKIHKLYKYLIPFNKMCNIAQINFTELFNFYSNYNPMIDTMDEMNNHVRTDIHLLNFPILVKQMHAAEWYGRIIYSQTLEELETQWIEAKQRGFGDEFHEAYYKLAQKRIQREATLSEPSAAQKMIDGYTRTFGETIQKFQTSVIQYKSHKIVKPWKFKNNSKKLTHHQSHHQSHHHS